MLHEPLRRKVRAKKQGARPEATDTLIVVQVLFTYWTKASRGGKAVAVRSSLPKALVIPFSQELIPHPSYVIQASTNSLNWAPTYKRILNEGVHVRPVEEPFVCDSIVVRLAEDRLHVDYQWNFDSGMPRRHPHPDILTLEKGQWGRVHYNERHSTYHVVNCFDLNMWWYEDWIFNIGFFANVEPRVFLDTQPNQRYTNMSKLW